MSPLAEIGGKRLPFLRWSFIRLLVGMKKLTTEWQVGDGREDALADYVIRHARAADVDDVIRVIGEFCYTRSFMINVGDEKGALLEPRSAAPPRVSSWSSARTAATARYGWRACCQWGPASSRSSSTRRMPASPAG